jgi:hypothetical protein
MYTVAGFEEGAGSLRFQGKFNVLPIVVHEEAGRQLGRACKVDQMQAVVGVQPEVGHEPIVGFGQEVCACAEKVALGVNLGTFADGLAQACAEGTVWFGKKNALDTEHCTPSFQRIVIVLTRM